MYRRTLVILITLVGLVDNVQAQGRGRGRQPDVWTPPGAAVAGELIAVNRGRPVTPAAVKVDKSTRKGTIVARGKKVQKERNGVVTDECETAFTTDISVVTGKRQIELESHPDCTVTLVNMTDTNVVETVAEQPASWGQRLWQKLVPTLHAQEPFRYRTAYYDIWTCGINCLVEGLTMQQGSMSYKVVPYQQIVMTRAFGWFCTAGVKFDAATGQWLSNCLAPHHLPGGPMSQTAKGWWGYNAWIVDRVWGGPGSDGSPYIYATDQTSFFHQATQSGPRTYEHTLYVTRYVTRNGTNHCQSTFTGSIPGGPFRLYFTCGITESSLP